MSSLAVFMQFFSQIAGVRPQAEEAFGPVEETVETSLEHSDPTQDHGATEHESSSQPLVNVSQGIRLVMNRPEPQGCPALSSFKACAGVIPSEENSQAPARNASLASSQQPSPAHLKSLGVKVRDFAYENTLPAICPVSCAGAPRVPRQRQPTAAPKVLKRSDREWDLQEGPSNRESPQSLSGQRGSKKVRRLERKATEPLEESELRALERRTFKRLYSVVTSPRQPISTANRRISASPPTSPLTPPLSHIESQESSLIQTPPEIPFAVHVEDTSEIPVSQLDSRISRRPSHHTIRLDARSFLGISAPSPSLDNALPVRVPLINSLLEPPHLNQEHGADLRPRRRRGCGTTPPSHRYYLRQRPTPTSRAATQSRVSHQASSAPRSQPRRTRRVR